MNSTFSLTGSFFFNHNEFYLRKEEETSSKDIIRHTLDKFKWGRVHRRIAKAQKNA